MYVRAREGAVLERPDTCARAPQAGPRRTASYASRRCGGGLPVPRARRVPAAALRACILYVPHAHSVDVSDR